MLKALGGIARLLTKNDDAFFAYVMIKTCFHYFNLVSGFFGWLV